MTELDGWMGRWVDGWMDGWTGVRSQLTCVILESQKTIQHLLTVHAHNLSLSHSDINKTPLPLYEGAKRKSAGLFRQASRNTRNKNPSINISGFWGNSPLCNSCLVPLFVLEFVYPVYPSS